MWSLRVIIPSRYHYEWRGLYEVGPQTCRSGHVDNDVLIASRLQAQQKDGMSVAVQPATQRRDEMHKIIGEVIVPYKGQKVVAEVCEGNYLLLPGMESGKKGPPLSEEDYQSVLKQYPQYMAKKQAEDSVIIDSEEPKSSPPVSFAKPQAPATPAEEEQPEKDVSEDESAIPRSVSKAAPIPVTKPQKTQPQKPEQKKQASPKLQKKRPEPKEYDYDDESVERRGIPIKVVVISLIVILLAGVGFFVLNTVDFTSFGTGRQTYMVTVLTSSLDAGEPITENHLGAKEISQEEYKKLTEATYIDTDPTTGETRTVTPRPVLYDDRGLLTGLFLVKNLQPGTVLTDKMVTNQKVIADQYYVDVEVEPGQTQQIPVTANETKGQTEVEIVALIRTESGEVIEIPLSTLILEEKTLLDILNGNGDSILGQVAGN